MEIKLSLHKVLREDGDSDYYITPSHSFADIIRHMISEGADRQEIISILGMIKNDLDV